SLNCLQTHSAVKLTQNSRICSVTSTGLCQALGLSVWVAAQDPGGARQENSACAVCVLDVTLEPLFRAAGIGGRKGLARGLQAWETERCEKLMTYNPSTATMTAPEAAVGPAPMPTHFASSWVEVSLPAIRRNFRAIQSQVGREVNVCPVIKSDAY